MTQARKPKNVGAVLEEAVAQVARVLNGKTSDDLATYSNYTKGKRIQFISTGNWAIDRCLGGGIVRGRVVEIFGPYSGGKTMLALEILAQVTGPLGGVAAFEDTEVTFKAGMAQAVGVNLDSLVYSQPETVEDVGDHVSTFIKEFRKRDKSRLIAAVWDSVAETQTRHEVKEPDKQDMARAQVIGKQVRRLKRLLGKNDATFIIINQVREKIGVMWGNPETTPGGRAIPFAATQRIRLHQGVLYKERLVKIYDERVPVGVRVVVEVQKNKIAPPWKKCEVIINFTDGIVPWSGYAELLADEGVIEWKSKADNTFIYKGETFKNFQIGDMRERFPELR